MRSLWFLALLAVTLAFVCDVVADEEHLEKAVESADIASTLIGLDDAVIDDGESTRVARQFGRFGGGFGGRRGFGGFGGRGFGGRGFGGRGFGGPGFGGPGFGGPGFGGPGFGGPGFGGPFGFFG